MVRWWLAQADIAQVCGEGDDANWLCAYVLRETDNELLARAAGTGSTGLRVALILAGAWLVSRLLRRFVTRFAARMEQTIEERLTRAEQRGTITDTARFRTRRLQRLHAISGVMRGVVGTVVWATALLLVLSELGVSLQPVLAGAGLAGVVIGFGAQQLVRDVLAGIAMLIEDQYGVGDWIEVEGKFGQVERVGLRSTAFRDVDGTVHHVLNGSMQRVGNLSQEWARATFDVPLALDADIPAAKALIHRVACELAADEVWGQDIIGEPEIWGVQEFGPDGVRIRLVVPTKPLRNFDITRQLRERVKLALEQARMRMPSQLVELGGQRMGYTVLTREVDDEPTGQRLRRGGLVPADVGPFDRPPVGAAREGPSVRDEGEGAHDTDPAAPATRGAGPTTGSAEPTGGEGKPVGAATPADRHLDVEDERDQTRVLPHMPAPAPGSPRVRPASDREPAPDLTAELRRVQGPGPRPD